MALGAAVRATLTHAAEGGRAAFYAGQTARTIASAVQQAGGTMSEEDLAAHTADVLEPLSIDYRGYAVYETPPNSPIACA